MTKKPRAPRPEPANRSSWRSVSSSALKLVISGAAVGLLMRQIDERAMVTTLASARLAPMGGAILVYLFGQLVTAWRWEVIASAAGFREPMRKIVTWYFVGMFFNLFGPSTLGGDVVRSLYLGGPTARRTLALHTVLFDRLSGLAMLVAVALTTFLVFGAFGLPAPVVWLTAAAGIGLVAAWWTVPPLASRFLPASNRVRRLVEGDLRGFWTDHRLLAQTAAISVFFHVVQIGAVMLVGRAVGLGVPRSYYFIFHPLVSIFSALPVSLAGLGIREVGYVWFLTATAEPVAHETAAAFAVLWLAVLLAASAVGGFVFLLDGGGVPSLRRMEAAAARRAP